MVSTTTHVNGMDSIVQYIQTQSVVYKCTISWWYIIHVYNPSDNFCWRVLNLAKLAMSLKKGKISSRHFKIFLV